MHAEEIRDYCLGKKAVEESFPFDSDTLVFKVGGKVFLLIGLGQKPAQFNVKCDPDKAIELREKFSCILPGYHMNKTHWNTVICNDTISKKFVFELIDHSYTLVSASLPKKTRNDLDL